MIVLITDAAPPQTNGVVTTVVNTVAELHRQGYATTLITPAEFRTIPCPLYHEIPVSLLPGRRMRRRLRELVAQPGPLFFHIFTEGPLGIAARNFLAGRQLRFTTSYHTDFPQYLRKYLKVPPAVTWQALRWFHGPASRVLVSTPALQRGLAAHGIARLGLWGRGVDEAIFAPRGQPAEPPFFLYAGRVAQEKGVEDFLKLDLPGRKVVAGDGPHLVVLKARFPDAVYLGKLSQREIAPVMAEAAALVFPSRTDTYGIVMAEAAACGTPVAAFPVRGPLEVVIPGVTGFLDTDLADAARRCLALDRRAIAAEARERFSWQRATRQFLDNLCEARSAARVAAPTASRSVSAPDRRSLQLGTGRV